MPNLIVSKETFVNKFLTPLAKFDLPSKPAQVVASGGELCGITHSEDRSIILDCKLKNIKVDDFNPVVFKDLNKLKSAMAFVDNTLIKFNIADNYLSYEDDYVKLKSFFLDNKFFDSKQPQKMEKIRSLDFDFSFVLSQDALCKIRKSKQFASDTNKVYIKANKKDGVHISRKDDVKSKIDTIGFKVSDSFEGPEIDYIPLSIDLFDFIEERTESLKVMLNTKLSLFNIKSETAEYSLNYIAAQLRK